MTCSHSADYMCSDCKSCYQCDHKRVAMAYWICPDGRQKPVHFDEGTPYFDTPKKNKRDFPHRGVG